MFRDVVSGVAEEILNARGQDLEGGGAEFGRVRRPGAGRPDIEQALEQLVDPLTRGDPQVAVEVDMQEKSNAHHGAVEGWLEGQFDDGGPFTA